MKDYKKWIIIAVVMIAVPIICLSIKGGYDKSLANSAGEVNDLKNKISVAQAAVDQNNNEVVAKSAGLSADRNTKDTALINKFLTEIFTWDDIYEYETKRKKCVDTYKLKEDDAFFSEISDKILVQVYGDEGMNMAFEGADCYVSAISAGTYSYFNVVTISSVRDSVKAEAQLVVTCDVDANGTISNLGVFPIVDESDVD